MVKKKDLIKRNKELEEENKNLKEAIKRLDEIVLKLTLKEMLNDFGSIVNEMKKSENKNEVKPKRPVGRPRKDGGQKNV